MGIEKKIEAAVIAGSGFFRGRHAGMDQGEVRKEGLEMTDNLVSVEWLSRRLGRDDLVVADCRFVLADPQAGRRAYEQGHIPGALYFDLERDLSRPAGTTTGKEKEQPEPARGGRHPLPSIEEMARMFGAAGISDGIMVVCYDDQKGSMAARLWWMLRYLGHRSVALLDGGYSAWRAAGLPVTAQVPRPTPRTFIPRVQQQMVATMEEVRRVSASGEGIIVDSRTPERYRGEVEPIDPAAGHIPGAINLPWDENVDEKGMFVGQDRLVQRFERLREAAVAQGDVIVHCGSGVTGCLNILALERAGMSQARLYVGGWSEWCAFPGNAIAKGEER